MALFLPNGARVFELSSLLFQTGLDSLWVAMLMVTLLDAHHVVGVLLWQNLAVLHRLHGGVIVVLMDLTIDGGGSLLMTLLNDVLVGHGGCHLLMDSGIMVTSLGPMKKRIN